MGRSQLPAIVVDACPGRRRSLRVLSPGFGLRLVESRGRHPLVFDRESLSFSVRAQGRPAPVTMLGAGLLGVRDIRSWAVLLASHAVSRGRQRPCG